MKFLLATFISLISPFPASLEAAVAPIYLSGKSTVKSTGHSGWLLVFVNVGILLAVAAATWWVTGFDRTVGGESKSDRYLNRALRTGAVMFLACIFMWLMEQPSLNYGGMPILIIIPLCMALVLRSALSEIFAGGFLGLLDPTLNDHRELDPKVEQRYQDTIAHFIHTGKHDEAIKLCEKLKKSGEVPLMTLENTLEFLGVKQKNPLATRPLLEASRMRTAGDYKGAERLLKSLLAKNPRDEGAAIMLLRVYAQDLRDPDHARKVLESLSKQPHVSSGHVEFARRSLEEWLNPGSLAAGPGSGPPIVQGPQSVEELLAEGSLGTAVERLEQQIQAEPENLRLQLRLAEIYAVNCGNLVKAEKIIFQIVRTPGVSPEVSSLARAKLEEWHAQAEATRDKRFHPPD